MKKLLVVLLLAVLLIFGAGCVTSTDEIVGTWQTHDVFEGVTETTTQILFDDGTGIVLYDYFDGDEEVYPVCWTKMSDGTYLIEEFYSYTFPEDQKSMTDNWGSTFTLEDGAEKIGGVWTMINEDSAVYSVVFNEDGSGVRTVPQENAEPEENPFGWREINENQIAWWVVYIYPYTEDGRLDIGDEIFLTEDNGIWIESPVDGTYYTIGEIIGDFWVEKYYLIENGEYQLTNWYRIQESGDNGMVVGYTYTYTQTLQADGTILCDCGDVYTKVAA